MATAGLARLVVAGVTTSNPGNGGEPFVMLSDPITFGSPCRRKGNWYPCQLLKKKERKRKKSYIKASKSTSGKTSNIIESSSSSLVKQFSA